MHDKTTNNNMEEHINKIIDSLGTSPTRISYIVSGLDLSEFVPNIDYETKFPIIPNLRLFILRNIKGVKELDLRSYEKVKKYLNTHKEEAYELGFITAKGGKIVLSPKRTYNNYLKIFLTDDKKQKLLVIAKQIADAVKNKILLNTNNVEKTLEKEIPKQITYDDKHEVTKFMKKIFCPVFDFKMKKNSKYNKKNIMDSLYYTSKTKSNCVKGGCQIFKDSNELNSINRLIPSGRTVIRHIHKLKNEIEFEDELDNKVYYLTQSGRQIEEMFHETVKKTISELKKYTTILNRKVDIAIDYHDRRLWSKERRLSHAMTVNTKKGKNVYKSLRYFHKYLVFNIVGGSERLILVVIPVMPGDLTKKEELIKRGLSKIKELGIRIGDIYCDREFNDKEVYKLIKNYRVHFVMAYKRSKKTDKLYDLCEGERSRIFYNQNKGTKKNPIYVNIGVIDRKDKKGKVDDKNLFVFNDRNIKPGELHEKYRKRWGIETCFRVVEHNEIVRTTSNDYFARAFDFMLSCSFYNLGILLNVFLSIRVFGKINNKPLISMETVMLFLSNVGWDYLDKPPGT